MYFDEIEKSLRTKEEVIIAKELKEKIKELETKISEIEYDQFLRAFEKVKELIESGWVEFRFYSEYYGSHSEYGEGDEETIYLFDSSLELELEQWKNTSFSHGHFSENEDLQKFKEWIENIEEDKYVIFDVEEWEGVKRQITS